MRKVDVDETNAQSKIPGWATQWSSLHVSPDLPTEYMQLSVIEFTQHFYSICKQNAKIATESRITVLEEQIEKLTENLDDDQKE